MGAATTAAPVDGGDGGPSRGAGGREGVTGRPGGRWAEPGGLAAGEPGAGRDGLATPLTAATFGSAGGVLGGAENSRTGPVGGVRDGVAEARGIGVEGRAAIGAGEVGGREGS